MFFGSSNATVGIIYLYDFFQEITIRITRWLIVLRLMKVSSKRMFLTKGLKSRFYQESLIRLFIMMDNIDLAV